MAVAGKYVYWTNNALRTIGRARLNGTEVNQTFIADSDPANPEGIAIHGSYIYWSNYGPGVGGGGTSIGRAKLNGTEVEPEFITGASAPAFIAVGPGR